jgi:hypothetical protein
MTRADMRLVTQARKLIEKADRLWLEAQRELTETAKVEGAIRIYEQALQRKAYGRASENIVPQSGFGKKDPLNPERG